MGRGHQGGQQRKLVMEKNWSQCHQEKLLGWERSGQLTRLISEQVNRLIKFSSSPWKGWGMDYHSNCRDQCWINLAVAGQNVKNDHLCEHVTQTIGLNPTFVRGSSIYVWGQILWRLKQMGFSHSNQNNILAFSCIDIILLLQLKVWTLN